MQNYRPGTIKGLSIAVIVLSILGIIGCFILFALLGAANDMVQNYEYYPELAMSFESYGMSELEAMEYMSIFVGIGGFLIFLLIVASAVSLVAGILGMKNANNPINLGGCFGWSIAGAIVSFLTGTLISTILLIILAVVANGDKKLAKIMAQQPLCQPVVEQPQTQPVVNQSVQPIVPQQPAQSNLEQPTQTINNQQ